MTVRAANFVDIPRMVEIMRSMHVRSRHGHCTTFDEVEAKQLLVRCIQRHGHQNYMGSLVLVSETENHINGFLIGILDQVYPCIKELKATDLFIMFDEGASARDLPSMILRLIEWASSNPKVIQVLLGVTDEVAGWHRVAPIYERQGLESCGGFYRIDFDRSETQKAEGF